MREKQCKDCKHIRAVKKLGSGNIPKWYWFNICDLFINEPDGWGIVVNENDRCECFSKKEDNDMKVCDIEVKKTEVKTLHKVYVLRGILDETVKKVVINEKRFFDEPDEQEIAQFLTDNPRATFCVLEEIYELRDPKENKVKFVSFGA